MATAIGFGLLAASLKLGSWTGLPDLAGKTVEPNEAPLYDNEAYIRSMFPSRNALEPRGMAHYEKMYSNEPRRYYAQGNPEDRNMIATLILHPNQKESSRINKDGAWADCGLLDREKQIEMIRDKIDLDDERIFWPDYKQFNGRTITAPRPINLMYWPGVDY